MRQIIFARKNCLNRHPNYQKQIAVRRQQKILLGRKGKSNELINKALAEGSKDQALQRPDKTVPRERLQAAAEILMLALKQEAEAIVAVRTERPKGPPELG